MTAGQITPHIGRSVARIGGADHVTGGVRYTADLAATAALRVVFVRSTCAHGEIDVVDTAAARALAGVRAVFDGADALRLTEPIPHFIDPAARGAIAPMSTASPTAAHAGPASRSPPSSRRVRPPPPRAPPAS